VLQAVDVRYSSTYAASLPSPAVLRVRSDIALDSASPLASAATLLAVQTQTAAAIAGTYTTLVAVQGDGSTTFNRYREGEREMEEGRVYASRSLRRASLHVPLPSAEEASQ